MSVGLGRVERRVLKILGSEYQAFELSTLANLIGSSPATYKSVARAISSLERKGLTVSWRHGGWHELEDHRGRLVGQRATGQCKR